MPHQCVRCNTFYDDGSQAILKGCNCGGRLFFFIKKEKLEQARSEIQQQLTVEQKEQLEQDVMDIVGQPQSDTPVILDFESIRVLTPGKYEIDLVQLFKGEPVIFKLDEGKYVIDLAETFQRMKKKS
jgi:predicted  nucleic acid-binding Zn-ribbon protein